MFIHEEKKKGDFEGKICFLTESVVKKKGGSHREEKEKRWMVYSANGRKERGDCQHTRQRSERKLGCASSICELSTTSMRWHEHS